MFLSFQCSNHRVTPLISPKLLWFTPFRMLPQILRSSKGTNYSINTSLAHTQKKDIQIKHEIAIVSEIFKGKSGAALRLQHTPSCPQMTPNHWIGVNYYNFHNLLSYLAEKNKISGQNSVKLNLVLFSVLSIKNSAFRTEYGCNNPVQGTMCTAPFFVHCGIWIIACTVSILLPIICMDQWKTRAGAPLYSI